MLLTQQEALVAWQALNVKADGQQKTFPYASLGDVSKVCKEIKAKCVDEKEMFKKEDCEIDLDTDCKKLLKDALDREWPAAASEAVKSLEEKLAQ